MRTRTLTHHDADDGLTVTFDVEYDDRSPADFTVTRVVGFEMRDPSRSIVPEVIEYGHHDSPARRAAAAVWRARVDADPGLRAWAAGQLAGGGR